MSHGSLTTFSPRNTAVFEARLWQAYYDRRWVRSLILLYRLMRSQFNLGAVQALRATFWGTLAAIVWAPANNDRGRVGRLLIRFYRVVGAATGASFDAEAAGAAELQYWAVHRDLSGQQGTPELIAALAGIVVAVYGLSPEQARPSAAARAHACDLVDAITAGKQAPTPEAWAAISTSLRQAYSLLCEALGATQVPVSPS
jgi:hypothetical protein